MNLTLLFVFKNTNIIPYAESHIKYDDYTNGIIHPCHKFRPSQSPTPFQRTGNGQETETKRTGDRYGTGRARTETDTEIITDFPG